MKPVYFPFTYICEPLARRLCQLFGQMTVYLPTAANIPANMNQLQRDGYIALRFPFSDDGDQLMDFSRDFKAWGEQHYRDGASLKNAFSEGFYNQTFTAQIRSDILKHDKPVETSSDPVFTARLFLLMAQELDAQQDDLDQKLADSFDAEQELFARMNGQERPGVFEKQIQRTDYGSVMTASRLSAWSHLFFKDAPESCFLVTTSRASVGQMMESFSDMEQIAQFEEIPCDLSQAQRKELSQYLEALSQTPWPDAVPMACPCLSPATHGDGVNLSVYILPGIGSHRIAGRLSGIRDANRLSDQSPVNTILCLVE